MQSYTNNNVLTLLFMNVNNVHILIYLEQIIRSATFCDVTDIFWRCLSP